MKKFFNLTVVFLLIFSICNAETMYKSWGAERIHVKEFVDVINNEAKNGEEIVVAVIDSGVYTEHEVFNDRITNNDHNNNDVNDNNLSGHGTHVAGIIADLTQGTNVKILPLSGKKIIEMNPDDDWVCKGIDYAIAQNVDVINLSQSWWWNYDNSGNASTWITEEEEIQKKEKLYDKIEEAIEKGIVFVISTGNQSTCLNSIGLLNPEKYSVLEDVVFVGSLSNGTYEINFNSKKESDEILKSSNYGEIVDVIAPGLNILSTAVPDAKTTNRFNEMKTILNNNNISFNDLGYTEESLSSFVSDSKNPYIIETGTSMAAPHVSSIIALYKIAYPTLTSKQLVYLLKDCVDDIKDTKIYGGVGVPNMLKALCNNSQLHIFDDSGRCSECGYFVKEDNDDIIIPKIKCTVCREPFNVILNCRKTETMHIYTCPYDKNNNHTLKVENHTLENGRCTVCGYEVKKDYTNNFVDIDSSHWAYRDIGYMYEEGIVKGTENKETGEVFLKPNDHITAEAFICLVSRVLGYKGQEISDAFLYIPQSIKGEWSEGEWKYLMTLLGENAKKEIQTILAANSQSDNEISLKYFQTISRESAAYLMGLFVNNNNFNFDNSLMGWDDVNTNYYRSLRILTTCGLINGIKRNNQSYIDPKEPITRAQAVTLISRLYALKEAELLK